MTDEQILDAILRREGGFVNHPQDMGRATNYGITMATLASWRGHDVSVDDVRSLDVEEAKAIYRARYVKPFDGVDPELKPQVVDIAVHSGVTTARALLAVASQQSVRPVRVQLVVERLRHFARIVKAKPTQSVFLLGWMNRAVEFL